ncbi:unnamed protein product [Sphagnum balticum]
MGRLVSLRGTRQSASHPPEINRRFSRRGRSPPVENLRRAAVGATPRCPRRLRLVLRTFGYVGRVLAQLRGAPAVAAALGNLRVYTLAVVCAHEGNRRLSARAR